MTTARYQLLLSGRGTDVSANPKQNHQISGNVLYAVRAPQRVLYFDPRLDYGTLRGNWLCCPYTADIVAFHVGWPGSGDQPMTLAAWQKDYAWADKDARTLPADLAGTDRSRLFINDHESPLTIPLDEPYLGLDGKTRRRPHRAGPVLQPHPHPGRGRALSAPTPADDALRRRRGSATMRDAAGTAHAHEIVQLTRDPIRSRKPWSCWQPTASGRHCWRAART